MDNGGDGQVPCGVSGHTQAEKWPNPVIMERRYKNSGCTTCTEYVSPCSLVQVIVYVINVTATKSIIIIVNHPLII